MASQAVSFVYGRGKRQIPGSSWNGKQVVHGLMMIEISTDKPEETVKLIRVTSEHLRVQGDLGC